MPPWLFNIYMNGMLREVEKMLQKGQETKNVKEWNLLILIYADNLVLVAEKDLI